MSVTVETVEFVATERTCHAGHTEGDVEVTQERSELVVEEFWYCPRCRDNVWQEVDE